MKATIFFLYSITLSIWYYLVYKILTIVGANELMWFLYYIYVPVGMFNGLLVHLIQKEEK